MRLWGILLFVLCCACDSSPSDPAGSRRGGGSGGGSEKDATTGTQPDAAAGSDAGVTDGIVWPDAGSPLPDATAQAADAAHADATPAQDAGTPVADAGTAVADAGHGTPDTGAGAPDATTNDPGPAILNPNWIGGPCTSNSDCNFTGGRCLTQGYPGGTCTQDCSRVCPDQSGPLNSVTFCIDDGDGDADGQCVSRCDQTLSPTGCRNGYVCLPEKRMGQPEVVRRVCVPRTGVPGRPVPAFDIGDACLADADCNRNTCMTDLSGGYCSQEACDIVGCPSGSQCFRLGLEDYHVCLKNCATSGQCRTGEGYTCDSDNTCWWYPPPRPTCNLSGGAALCQQYAPNASQDFVVVTKSARRLVHCNGASVVNTYCVGLGSSPVLDKEREGDRRTPEGVFYIPRVLPNSQYYKAFLLSYPDTADAARGLAAGLITRSEHDSIVAAQNARREPPQFTGLGGLIEIHGRGGSSDWTWGCIAVDDTTIDALWGTLGVGDNIIVVP